MGFPCNQFGNQEPGSNEEVAQFARDGKKVQWDLFQKCEVNGSNAHPLWRYLKANTDGEEINWNFNKYLVKKDGTVFKRYKQSIPPLQLDQDIDQLIQQDDGVSEL